MKDLERGRSRVPLVKTDSAPIEYKAACHVSL